MALATTAIVTAKAAYELLPQRAKERVQVEALGMAMKFWARFRIAWRVFIGKYGQDVSVCQGIEWPANRAVHVCIFAKAPTSRGDIVLEEAHGVRVPINIRVTNVSPFRVTLTHVHLKCFALVSSGIAEANVDTPTTYINIAPGEEYVWTSEVIGHVGQSNASASGACSKIEAHGYIVVEGPWVCFEDRKNFESAIWVPLVRQFKEPPALSANV